MYHEIHFKKIRQCRKYMNSIKRCLIQRLGGSILSWKQKNQTNEKCRFHFIYKDQATGYKIKTK